MQRFDSVLAEVKEMLPEGYKVALVGGAVRDTLLGLKPKYLDISIVAPLKTDCEVTSDISKLLGTKLYFAVLHGFSENYSVDEPLTPTSDFNERLVGVVKTEIQGYPVDLLFQRDPDFLQVVQGYDHIANMVYYEDGELKRAYSTNALNFMYKYHDGFTGRRDLRDVRKVKMENIFEEYKGEILNYLGIKEEV